MAREAGKYSLLLCSGGREKENYKSLAIYAIEMEKKCISMNRFSAAKM